MPPRRPSSDRTPPQTPRRSPRDLTPPQAPRRSRRTALRGRPGTQRQVVTRSQSGESGTVQRRGVTRSQSEDRPSEDYWLRSLPQPPTPPLRQEGVGEVWDWASSSSSESEGDGDSILDDISSSDDFEFQGDLSIGHNIHFAVFRQQRDVARALHGAFANMRESEFFVPPDVVPPQNHDPTSECGGTWRKVADDQWRLVDNLAETELTGVQMRLGDMERRPSPPPSPPTQQQQQQQQEQPREEDTSPKEIPCCRVCLDKPVGIVFRNCGHYCICGGCRNELVQRSESSVWLECPVCRQKGDTIEVYM